MRPTRTTSAPPGLEVTPYAVQNAFRRTGSPRHSTANHSCSPGLSTQGEELFAPDRLACSATPRQRPLGSHLAMPSSRPGLATANRKTTRDASDRLLQSTFQRRAPVLRVKTDSLTGLAPRARQWVSRFTRSTRFGLSSRARVRRFLPDPDPRDDRTSDAPVTVGQPTTLLAMPSIRRPSPSSPSLREERWLPTAQGAFPRQGALPGPSASTAMFPSRSGHRRPFTPVGFPTWARPRPPSTAATADGFTGPDAA